MPPLKRSHLDKAPEGSVFCKLSDLITVLCEICTTINVIRRVCGELHGDGKEVLLQRSPGQEFSPIWPRRAREPVEKGVQGWVWIWGSVVVWHSHLLLRKHGQRTQHVVRVAREGCGFSANATVLAVLPCLFTRGLCEAAGQCVQPAAAKVLMDGQWCQEVRGRGFKTLQ